MPNDVTIHVKAEGHVDRDIDVLGRKAETAAKRSFLKTGGHAGAAFAAGFIKTITFGMVGSGFAQAATKMMPRMAHVGGLLGAGLAAGFVMKAVSAISAALPLALGGAALAGPIIYLFKGMVDKSKELEKVNTKIASLEDRNLKARGKSRQEIERQWEAAVKQKTALEAQVTMLQRLKSHAKHFMDTISKPVAEPLAKSIHIIDKTLDRWAPKVQHFMKQLAPELPGFTKGALKAIENFAKEVFGKNSKSIKEGMKAWGDAMPGIGKSLGKLVDKILKDPKGTVDAVKGLAKGIENVGKAAGDAWENLEKFTDAYSRFSKFIDKHEGKNSDTDQFDPGIGFLPKPATVHKMMNSVAKAFSWGVSRIGDALDNLKGHLSEARGGISRFASGIASRARSMGSAVAGAFRSMARGARNAIGTLMDHLGEARAGISRFASRARSVIAAMGPAIVSRIRAMANGMLSAIRNMASRAVAAMHSLGSRIRGAFAGAGSWLVSAGRRLISGLIAGIRGAAGAAASAAANVVRSAINAAKSLIPGRASGGMVGAGAATGGARGGQVLVGEQGPEIVDLPMGSHVNSNADSRRIASGGRGGRGDVHLHFHNSVVAGATDLQRMLSDMKRRGQLDVILR